MPRIINVEKSDYIQKTIEIYSKNRVGQYSKFLDKNPLFVTYLHINENESTNDVGTGAVAEDVGNNSPIRFNQINQLPTYNLPELKPEAVFDDNTGYDIEMDITDGVLLPGTIKPKIGDYMIVYLPNMPELCFRINGFNYTTIQSNDFYTYSADLKFTGKDLIKRFERQIVEVYETIFENIGTDDKCFIRSTDVKKIQTIADTFREMRSLYFHNFFDQTTGTFVCKNNKFANEDAWLYDKYLEKFIMESEIYFEEDKEESVVLYNADIEQDMEREFYRTLEYAVLHRDASYLQPYPYYYQVDIQKRLSPFKVNHINCKSVNLLITRKRLVTGHSDALDYGTTVEYYSHTLIDMILHPEKYMITETCDSNQTIEQLIVSFNKGEQDESIDEIVAGSSDHRPIHNHANTNDPNEIPYFYKPKEPERNIRLTYLDQIVYEFMRNRTPTIEKNRLIPYILRVDNYTYRMVPLVLYIILQYYQSFFKKEEDI